MAQIILVVIAFLVLGASALSGIIQAKIDNEDEG